MSYGNKQSVCRSTCDGHGTQRIKEHTMKVKSNVRAGAVAMTAVRTAINPQPLPPRGGCRGLVVYAF